MKLLHLDASALGDNSASRALTQAVVNQLRAEHPGLTVTYRDLDADPLPHLTARSLARVDAEETARAAGALQDFLDADALVIGAPMYNFSIPSTLKAWIDRVAVAGKTFRYTAEGPRPLTQGKRAYIVSTQGGVHAHGGPSDHQESYLRLVLGFLGVTEVEFVRAQGLSLSPEHRRQAMAAALARWTPSTSRAA